MRRLKLFLAFMKHNRDHVTIDGISLKGSMAFSPNRWRVAFVAVQQQVCLRLPFRVNVNHVGAAGLS